VVRRRERERVAKEGRDRVRKEKTGKVLERLQGNPSLVIEASRQGRKLKAKRRSNYSGTGIKRRGIEGKSAVGNGGQKKNVV